MLEAMTLMKTGVVNPTPEDLILLFSDASI